MAWADDIDKIGQSWVHYIRIKPRVCTNTYGNSPCTASGGQCAYSWATCEDKDNFTLGTRTFEFSSKEGPKIFDGTQVQPTLEKVNELPTEINPSKSITINARVQLTFQDAKNPPPFDSDKGAGKFYTYRDGTFWRIFKRIYRESFKYCILELYEGLPSYTSISDFSLRRKLFINNIEILNNGKVRVTATDKTRSLKTIKIPNAISSSNITTAQVTAGDSIIPVTDDSEFKILSAGYSSYAKIIDSVAGDEYVKFTEIDSTGALADVTRGLFGTSDVTHAAGKKVIQVAVFADDTDTGIAVDLGVNPVDAMKEIILGWVGVDAADVDDTQFDAERDLWYISPKFRRIVESPITADKLLAQLRQFTMSNIWQDEEQKLTFKALAPIAPGESRVEFRTDENIIDDSLSVNDKVETQVSRIIIHFDPDDTWGTKDHTSEDEFNQHLIWINTSAEDENGQADQVDIEFFADWIYNVEEAQIFASRYSRRYSPVAPVEIQFKATRRDAEVETGDFIDLTAEQFVDDDGSIDTLNFQILSKAESQNGIITMKALETKFEKKYGFIGPAGLPDWTSASTAQRKYAYIADTESDGTPYMSDGGPVTYIW